MPDLAVSAVGVASIVWTPLEVKEGALVLRLLADMLCSPLTSSRENYASGSLSTSSASPRVGLQFTMSEDGQDP